MNAAGEPVTLVACWTPPGRGAIATLGLRGARAWSVLRDLVQPPLPESLDVGWFRLGRVAEDTQAKAAEEVVVAIRKAMPVAWVEVHCHGGVEVVRWLIDVLVARGLQACTWQEMERATTDDPWRAQAAAALAESLTPRTAAILLDQYHGALRRALDEIRTFLGEKQEREAIARIEELARFAQVGRHLTRPWRVAVLGAPNVGKSSLVNALAGFQRSLVSATPGTTRDVVTTRTAVDGWPVELADTAGLRPGNDNLEKQGMELARQTAADADLCLWVLDAASAPVFPDFSLATLRLVVNKSDLPAVWDLGRASNAVAVSARTGTGLDDLCRQMAAWLVPDPPPRGAAVPFTPDLCERVERTAIEHLAEWPSSPIAVFPPSA